MKLCIDIEKRLGDFSLKLKTEISASGSASSAHQAAANRRSCI